MRRVFAMPAYRRLFVALAATMVADSVLLLTFGIWVKTLTGSAAAAGMTIFALVLPSLGAPVLGWVVDRFARRRFLLTAYPLAALSLAPLAAVDGPDRVWVLYAVVGTYGIGLVMLPAATSALVKLVVPVDDLVAANAAASSFREGLRLIGPLLGAALFGAFGMGVVVAVAVTGFAVATAAIAGLRLRADEGHAAERDWRTELGAGFAHLVGDPMLRYPVLAMAAAVFVFGCTEPLVYVILDAFGRPATFLGVVVTVQGVGALAGGLASMTLIRRVGCLRGMLVALALFTVGLGAMAVAPSVEALLAALVPFGFGLPLFVVATNTLLQRRTPDRLMGRVMTASSALVSLPHVVSIAAGAAAMIFIDWRPLMAALATSTLLIALTLGAWVTRGRTVGPDGPPGVATSSAAPSDRPAGRP